MPEKNLAEIETNAKNLTQKDRRALREYYELLDRWKVRLMTKRNIINGFLNQNSDMEEEERRVIDQMSEEAREIAREMRLSAANYLTIPGKSEVM